MTQIFTTQYTEAQRPATPQPKELPPLEPTIGERIKQVATLLNRWRTKGPMMQHEDLKDAITESAPQLEPMRERSEFALLQDTLRLAETDYAKIKKITASAEFLAGVQTVSEWFAKMTSERQRQSIKAQADLYVAQSDVREGKKIMFDTEDKRGILKMSEEQFNLELKENPMALGLKASEEIRRRFEATYITMQNRMAPRDPLLEKLVGEYTKLRPEKYYSVYFPAIHDKMLEEWEGKVSEMPKWTRRYFEEFHNLKGFVTDAFFMATMFREQANIGMIVFAGAYKELYAIRKDLNTQRDELQSVTDQLAIKNAALKEATTATALEESKARAYANSLATMKQSGTIMNFDAPLSLDGGQAQPAAPAPQPPAPQPPAPTPPANQPKTEDEDDDADADDEDEDEE